MSKQSAFFKQELVTVDPLQFRFEFQTPPVVAKYMCTLIPLHCETVLEPAPRPMLISFPGIKKTGLREIKRYGLKSVTALPRKTFQYARIQTVVLEMEKGYQGSTEMKVFDCLTDHLKIPLDL